MRGVRKWRRFGGSLLAAHLLGERDMNMTKTALLAAALTAAPGYALAATHTVTETYTIATTATPFTIDFTLPGFDTSLGALTGVEMMLSTTTAALVNVFNFNLASETFSNATVSVPVTVTGPGSTHVTATDVAGPAAGSVAAGGFYFVPALGSYTLVAGETTVTGLTGSANDSAAVASSDFWRYEGATIDLSYSAAALDGSYAGTAPTLVAFSGSAQTGGTFQLVYTYDLQPVPEAPTWAMIGLGFAALGYAGFRTRKGASAVA
jgi:hypothetical protein